MDYTKQNQHQRQAKGIDECSSTDLAVVGLGVNVAIGSTNWVSTTGVQKTKID